MNATTNTNTRGVTEAMRTAGAMLANCAFNLAQCDRLTERERRSLDESRKAWDQAIAALSAPEPAAQGEAVAWQYRRLDEEEGPSPYWHHMTREQYEMFRDNPRSNCEVRQLFTDPPAQTAERVPDGWKLAMWVLQSDLYRKLPEEERAVCDALVAENPYIAASPAPSEGGKGVEG